MRKLQPNAKCDCDNPATHMVGNNPECDRCKRLRFENERRRHIDDADLTEESIGKVAFVRKALRKYQETFSLNLRRH